MIERTVGADAVQPGGESGPAIESANVFPRPQKGFLRQIFRVVLVAAHTICQFVDSSGMLLHQETKGFVIALLRQFHVGVEPIIHFWLSTG